MPSYGYLFRNGTAPVVPQVAVIIPFFQRESGILAKAIVSVLAQSLPAGSSVWIIVVDDRSPVPATDEIAALNIPDHVRTTVHLVDKNGGPGAARNKGLEIANDGGAAYCAFLDSDDVWIASHLDNAITMIGAGTQAYFADHGRPGEYESGFSSEAPMFWNSPTVRTKLAERSIQQRQSTIFFLEADLVRDGLVYEYIFQTSTVVFCLSAAGHVRFDTRLKSAGEDHLFWFDLASNVNTFAINSVAEVECGLGVNICFSSFSWSNPQSVGRYGYQYLMLREMQSRGLAHHEEREHVRLKMREMRNNYAYLALKHLLRGHVPHWTLLSLIARTELNNFLGRNTSSLHTA